MIRIKIPNGCEKSTALNRQPKNQIDDLVHLVIGILPNPPALGAVVFLLFLACSNPAPSHEATLPPEVPLVIRTSSYPMAWLVDQLMPSGVDHQNILPAGEDPLHWQPSAEHVSEVQGADLIVAGGGNFEAWIQTATLPAGHVVNAAAGLELIALESQTHSHGVEGEHSHAGDDPHIWMDPTLYGQQAANIAQAIKDTNKVNPSDVDRTLTELQEKLQALDTATAAILNADTPALIANHPAYNYLAQRHSLSINNLDIDPSQEPTAAQLRAFMTAANNDPAPILIWEATPSEAAQAAFPNTVRHLVIDPLEQPSEGAYDYLAQATKNNETFQSTIKGNQD